MAFDEKTKAFVRRFYVFERLSLELAAEKAEVSFNTARRWKKQALSKGDDWDKVRDAHVMAGGELENVSRSLLTGFILEYRQAMASLNEADLDPLEKAEVLAKMADSFTKMTAASKRIMPEVSALATALKTVELLGKFIQQHKPQLLAEFLDLLGAFGETLDSEFK
ncbi:DUF1804 family protein [Lonepinella sp. BR2474]|uniref:DUF1804 family protein n=1 Tax=unclassified Lonepinella TaxID=2642006 RepID=UPI003F6DD10B